MAVVVTSDQVAAYRGLVEVVADRLYRPGRYIWRDDLVQEGLIAVWKTLLKGQKPNDTDLERGMLKWIRKERNRGFTYASPDDEIEQTDLESISDSLVAA